MKILICGMGSKDRGDDGIGPYIVDNFEETQTVKKIDCGLYPENYLNKIVDQKPDLIIFVDAMDHGGPGIKLLRDEEITESSQISVSTHQLSLRAMYEFIKAYTKAHIWFLGVKPYSYDTLSDKSKENAATVINIFNLLDKQSYMDIIELYETVSTTFGQN